MPIELNDFEGVWQLDRRIEDVRAGQVIQGTGTARFVPDDAGLIYDEELSLQVPGAPMMQATRRYLWRAAPEGIAILFDDERPFHTIRLTDAAPEDRHYCDPDIYDVAYDLSQFPQWHARWRVSGPRKNYVLTSRYAAIAK